MQQKTFQEKYPVFEMTLPKEETSQRNVAEVIATLRDKIEAHPITRMIAEFDHYAHTRSLPGGEVAEGIIGATNIVFCFGIKLPGPTVMAVRPRSIGVTEYADRFVINFLEPPMAMATEAMEAWVRELKDRPAR
ncbi:MAG: DUF6858 family protein [Halothiobacillaceae bacterium]